MRPQDINIAGTEHTHSDFSYDLSYALDAGKGLSHATIDYISDAKGECPWIRQWRHEALDIFLRKPMPQGWPPEVLQQLRFEDFHYYLAQGTESKKSWEDVAPEVKKTFERLGIPEQERKFLAGVEAQFDSEAAYSRIQSTLQRQGVIFVSSSEGLAHYPEIFRKYFGQIVPVGDNKFSALNSAVFSGGSFIYVPPYVKVTQPLQAYFRINAENSGQFERTLIIVDEGAEMTYMEGCTAPSFSKAMLHSAVVELVVLPHAKVQYISVQNWSRDVFNLVTKRGVAYENSEIRWIDCNIGSKLTMKYPCIILKEKHAKGEMVSISVAHDGQWQDTGAKMIHLSSGTSSRIVSKSISIGTGIASTRSFVDVHPSLEDCKNHTQCDALLLDAQSHSCTSPAIRVWGNLHSVQHEASVSKISEEQLFYLQQRGIPKAQALSLSVNGFINDLIQEFPMEYSVELKRLIELEMEGAVG
ncbi:MAG: Fe-S cluster assembly protein SufB [Puniceicoccales bacterium]|jgi:Fe-S cluster assembly protein SufB|nr:Fe-S cluster assembly protein SufB [Puniceicoccales bacterium]